VVDGEQGGISKAVNWQGGGGFHFYRLGAELFNPDGSINKQVRFADLAAYIWFCETRTPYAAQKELPLPGIYKDTAYYLLYNGILKDKTLKGGNILTAPLMAHLPPHEGKKIIYALGCRLSAGTLDAYNIHYRHIPYQIPGEKHNG